MWLRLGIKIPSLHTSEMLWKMGSSQHLREVRKVKWWQFNFGDFLAYLFSKTGGKTEQRIEATRKEKLNSVIGQFDSILCCHLKNSASHYYILENLLNEVLTLPLLSQWTQTITCIYHQFRFLLHVNECSRMLSCESHFGASCPMHLCKNC